MVAKYNTTGKIQGIYGYKVDVNKTTTPLNNTPTSPKVSCPSNNANSLKVKKYNLALFSLISGIFLF